MNSGVSNFPVIDHLCHAPSEVMLLVMILGFAGFVAGVTGFGFSLFGVGVLWILPPREGIPLLMLLSACSQIFSIAQLRASMPPLRTWWPQGPAPCVIGGWLGLPVGLWVLSHLDAKFLCLLIGLILVAYSLWMILKPANMRPIKRTLPGAFGVGLLGGVVGGVSAAPGTIMVIWANLQGLNKETQRATVQPYILAMQLLSLLLFVIRGGVFSGCLLILWVSSFVVILITTRVGVLLFQKLSNRTYNFLVVIMLALSGLTLLIKESRFLGGVLAKLDHLVFSI